MACRVECIKRPNRPDKANPHAPSYRHDNIMSRSTSSSSATRLSYATMTAYGAPAVMLAAFSLTFYVYLPKFYADLVGVDLALIGGVALASRLWDAVTDPTIGHISDRTRSKFGRRRPWMVISTPLLAVAFFALMAPPAAATGDPAVRLTVLSFMFFLFWTTLDVPYESLGAEISFDYDDRNRLFGVREAAVLLGTLIGAGLPYAVQADDIGETAVGFRLLGGIYAVALVAVVLWCVLKVPEEPAFQRPKEEKKEDLKRFPLRRNKPFVILQVAYTVYSLGGALAATVFLFFAEHVLLSSKGPLFLALYLLIGVVFLPMWIIITRRLEKRTAWLTSLATNTLAFSGVIWVGPGDELAFGVFISLTAVGLGGTLAISPSMQADVIDYDEWKTNRRREGKFIGMWALSKKFAMALSAGLALPILDWAGYIPGQALQSDTTVLALRWLYVGGPIICNTIAILLASQYHITRGMHRTLRMEIDARSA